MNLFINQLICSSQLGEWLNEHFGVKTITEASTEATENINYCDECDQMLEQKVTQFFNSCPKSNQSSLFSKSDTP